MVARGLDRISEWRDHFVIEALGVNPLYLIEIEKDSRLSILL